jgi:hypothetical protein
MLLFSMFLVSSDSNDQPSFVTIRSNSPIELSPEAEHILSQRPFLILVSGSPGSDPSFIANRLLEGVLRNESAASFFSPTPQSSTFRFHPGIDLTKFCDKWQFDCGPHPPNINVVIIVSPIFGASAPADADLRRTFLSLLPLLSVRIHVTAESTQAPENWDPILDEAGLTSVMADTYVPYGVALVVPGLEIPGMTDDTPVSYSEDARELRDATLTKSLWAKCSANWHSAEHSIVVAPPSAARWAVSFGESMRDIAGFVAQHRAQKAQPSPAGDMLAAFRAVSALVHQTGTLWSYRAIRELLEEMSTGKLMENWDLLFNQYNESGRRQILYGRGAFLVLPHGEDIAEEATGEYRRRLAGMVPGLRAAANMALFGELVAKLKQNLIGVFAPLVAPRRMELELGFSEDCEAAYAKAIEYLNEAYAGYSFWDLNLTEEVRQSFVEAVHISDLPPQMQAKVWPTFATWSGLLATAADGRAASMKNYWLVGHPLSGVINWLRTIFRITRLPALAPWR